HGELAYGQNLWRSVSDQHAAAPKRPPYHLKTVFACPLLFCDKKFLQVGLSCSNFTGSRTMRQSWARSARSSDSAMTSQAAKNVIEDRKSTRLNSSHLVISYAVFCLKKK